MEQQIRALLAWLPEQEDIVTIRGHIPGPTEDTNPQKEIWRNARRAVDERGVYVGEAPQLDPIPAQMQARADAFRLRADVNGALQGLDWTLGVANLNSVLSFQKFVVQEHATDRANAVVTNDPESLFSFCLPDQAEDTHLPGAIDQDQKAITFSSLNPNLRIGGHAAVEVELPTVVGQPPTKRQLIGFFITFGASFLQIAEYNGRWFVRDGYHRCYGLLRRGIDRVPCVFIRARSFEELVPQQAGFFPFEVLFGNKPPMLKDFLDDAVSRSVGRMATRKVVRVLAQDFLVVVE